MELSNAELECEEEEMQGKQLEPILETAEVIAAQWEIGSFKREVLLNVRLEREHASASSSLEEKESRQREDMMDKCALGEEEYITLLMDNMFTRMVDTVSSFDYVSKKGRKQIQRSLSW